MTSNYRARSRQIIDLTSPRRSALSNDLTYSPIEQSAEGRIVIDLTTPIPEQVGSQRIFIDLTISSQEPGPIISGEVRNVMKVTEYGQTPVLVHELPPAYRSVSANYHASISDQHTFPDWNGGNTTNGPASLFSEGLVPLLERPNVDHSMPRRTPFHELPEKPKLGNAISSKLPRKFHQLPERPNFDLRLPFKRPHGLDLLPEQPKDCDVVIDLTGDDWETEDDSDTDKSESILISSAPTSPTLPYPSNVQIDEPTYEILFKIRRRPNALDFAKEMLDMPTISGSLHYHIFWTDGSLPRHGNGGAAVVWKAELWGKWKSLRRQLRQPDHSNLTELHGIEMAVGQALKLVQEDRGVRQTPLTDQVVILTDCTSCLNMIEDHYLDRYRSPRIYLSSVRLITGCLTDLRKMGVIIELHWVPAHSGIFGNELADREARSAARIDMKSRQAGSKNPLHLDIERFVTI
ncbi:hypothetical protein N7478_007538 [Penicillium angulare]|uniref:uncharacterized protein n=1 Tax=Penicillium angulare TaxID=116970 RepID=UPI00254019A4|nr:uncharacterized protein N7478_007538 [Penicillium angulare]KAJ5272413.1 hypothetical protein N7478_007538 [Penicillium angulare]